MPPFLRSCLAVFSGFMVMMVVLMFKPLLLRSFGPSSYGLLLANALFTFLAVGLGGYITAFVARVRPIEHAAALGAIVFVLNWLAYRRYTGGQPNWYLFLMGVVPPFVVLTAAAFYKEKPEPA